MESIFCNVFENQLHPIILELIQIESNNLKFYRQGILMMGWVFLRSKQYRHAVIVYHKRSNFANEPNIFQPHRIYSLFLNKRGNQKNFETSFEFNRRFYECGKTFGTGKPFNFRYITLKKYK